MDIMVVVPEEEVGPLIKIVVPEVSVVLTVGDVKMVVVPELEVVVS